MIVGLIGCGSKTDGAAPSGSALPGGLTSEQAARVLVKVGDETITLGEYATALERMDPFDRLRYQTPEKRKELLKEMIDLKLLAQEAKRRGLDKNPDVLQAKRQVLRDAVLDEAHKALPSPGEIPLSEVQAYFDANIDKYREPERRRVSVITTQDPKKAEEIFDALSKDPGEKRWAELYFENSGATEIERKASTPQDLAGDLGIVGPPGQAKGENHRVPNEIRDAVFKIEKVGGIYGSLVTIGKTFYVVRLSGKTEAHERTLAEADRQIRVELLKQKMKAMDAALEAELRTKFPVQIDEAALARAAKKTE